MDICKAIIDAELDITWETELRVDSVNDKLLDLLVRAGCDAIQYGVESGSDKILRDIKKHISIDQVRRAVDLALSRGLGVYCSFIIGLPSDTEETIHQTTEFMLELEKAGCSVFPGIVTPYPGTEIFERRDELGITIHDYNWPCYHPLRVCYSTKHLTKEKIGQLFMELLMKVNPELQKVVT